MRPYTNDTKIAINTTALIRAMRRGNTYRARCLALLEKLRQEREHIRSLEATLAAYEQPSKLLEKYPDAFGPDDEDFATAWAR